MFCFVFSVRLSLSFGSYFIKFDLFWRTYRFDLLPHSSEEEISHLRGRYFVKLHALFSVLLASSCSSLGGRYLVVVLRRLLIAHCAILSLDMSVYFSGVRIGSYIR